MRRIRLAVQYDGSRFNGWQAQPSGITIEGVLEECVYKLTGIKTAIIGAGRTDAGVHAIEQIAAFSSQSTLDVDVIRRALNAMLPSDIRVVDIGEAADDFHPRHDARSKRYSYMIANLRDIPVFIQKHVWWVSAPFDLAAMRDASLYLMGRHDFSSFRGSGCGSKEPVKNISFLEIERLDPAPFLFAKFQGDFIRICVEADAFLRYMVRNIVGTLAEVGLKRMRPEAIKSILESKERKLAGPTAPAKGLFLEKVIY